MDAEIARQARTALIVGVVGVGFLGFVFGLGAIVRARQVRRLIEEHGVGHVHLSRARAATILGIAGAAIWTVAAVILLV